MAELRMPEINYVVIAGNLTKDPVYRHTTNGTPVVNFTIASNRKFKDSGNQWQEDVCFVGIVAWNKLAESCKERVRKGSAVLVDGELQSRSWRAEDGSSRSIVEIKARRIQFLNKRFKATGEELYEEPISDYDDDSAGYTSDSFDKFLTDEESKLINE
ncbi:MAG: single-stranded DNA-binding protein [Ignavibacteriales bacterium]|jgi:single-strand binding protein|nr:Single-stranded DNA-binding protein [Ignavibacteriaceae bacterium]MBW7873890.1 single-stranded DNA-binding protein [Ignavibacteria bacterium]MBZ0197977.1 single-stranded DNA-binding protein [Ignavibacteriaceae bacterium]MCZ2143351.1 single-stranded DNA-binding protein [Ignavibacteriales bacterium]WKZ72323.1 MAG: single-stranded DNA-binding protein [Ignavibacteriaceae bacterium]